jgi:succinylglutamic semialdehyde dehydrogenase
VTEELRSVSPADPADEIGRFAVADAAAVDEAVERARRAFPAWREMGFEARAEILRRFGDLVGGRQEELAQLIAREAGKALWDARSEARLLPAKLGVTLAEGMQQVAGFEAGAGVRATYHARGVLVVLGPFNFPAHLPNGHIVPALATGNTVVFKPSELTPAAGAWMVQLWRQAGLPDGVLELVQGGAEVGRLLALHRKVDGVLFTGSYAAGRALAEAVLDQPGKILALEMGGSNAILVLDDADLDLAVVESALSMCATTGQRCSCASRLFATPRIIETFADKLSAVLRGLRTGPPLEHGIFMGPLISRAAYDKLESYRRLSDDCGGERLVRVEPGLLPPYVGPGLVRFQGARQTHTYQRDEIFGPEAALYPVADLEQAVAAANDSDYGLAASVFTRRRPHYEYCVGRIRTGVLNWNKGTIGASGKLPFGGLGKSGNDRPAGVSATLYCTAAQAHLESQGSFDPESLPPGMPLP